MQLNPAAMNVSSSSNERLSSAVQPNTFPPKHKGATFSPDRPSMRSSIVIFSTDRCTMIPKSQSKPKQLVPDDETLGVKYGLDQGATSALTERCQPNRTGNGIRPGREQRTTATASSGP